jgi:hypothetical protein
MDPDSEMEQKPDEPDTRARRANSLFFSYFLFVGTPSGLSGFAPLLGRKLNRSSARAWLGERP